MLIAAEYSKNPKTAMASSSTNGVRQPHRMARRCFTAVQRTSSNQDEYSASIKKTNIVKLTAEFPPGATGHASFSDVMNKHSNPIKENVQ
jgi:hypothetical protein